MYKLTRDQEHRTLSYYRKLINFLVYYIKQHLCKIGSCRNPVSQKRKKLLPIMIVIRIKTNALINVLKNIIQVTISTRLAHHKLVSKIQNF